MNATVPTDADAPRAALPLPESGGDGAGPAPALGRYLVRQQVGAGGFARVYRAFDPELELDVAVKVLKPEFCGEPGTVERFRREASTAAKLRHPNVITVLTVGRLEEALEGAPAGTPYLVMDYLPSSLAERLAAQRQLPEAEVVRIGEDVARGLAYAHEHGVVHRDVKPDNVLFARDGRAVVTDFGIARAVHADVSSASRQVVLGTPSYFSPEQARGLTLDGRSDLYGLGVTLYQAATGSLPFEGEGWYDVMRQHVEVPPISPRERTPTLSPAFEAVLLRCLAKEPSDRFASASELADALAAVRAQRQEAATVVVEAYAGAPRRASVSRRVLVGGVLAAAALAGVVWAIGSSDGSRTRDRLAGGGAVVGDSAGSPPDSVAGAVPGAPPVTVVPTTASLAVDAPEGAELFLDGRRVGRGSWRGDSLAPAEHRVRARLRSTLAGCPTATVDSTVALVPGEVRTLTLRPAACGELTFDVEPTPARYAISPLRGAGASRSGEIPAPGPVVLPEGLYRLQVSRPACAPFDDSVRVVAGPARRPERIRLFCS